MSKLGPCRGCGRASCKEDRRALPSHERGGGRCRAAGQSPQSSSLCGCWHETSQLQPATSRGKICSWLGCMIKSLLNALDFHCSPKSRTVTLIPYELLSTFLASQRCISLGAII